MNTKRRSGDSSEWMRTQDLRDAEKSMVREEEKRINNMTREMTVYQSLDQYPLIDPTDATKTRKEQWDEHNREARYGEAGNYVTYWEVDPITRKQKLVIKTYPRDKKATTTPHQQKWNSFYKYNPPQPKSPVAAYRNAYSSESPAAPVYLNFGGTSPTQKRRSRDNYGL